MRGVTTATLLLTSRLILKNLSEMLKRDENHKNKLFMTFVILLTMVQLLMESVLLLVRSVDSVQSQVKKH